MHIHFGGVVQAPRAQLDMLECFLIGPKGTVIVNATRHVGPVSGAHLAVSDFLEVENVEGLGGIADDGGRFLGILG